MRTLMKFVALAAFAGACGCSMHPLPYRVVGLETHAILQKIRCETQDAVDGIYKGKAASASLYDRSGFAKFKGGFSAERKKQFVAATDELKKARKDLDALNAEAARLQQRRDRINNRLGLSLLKFEKTTDDIIRKAKKSPEAFDINKAVEVAVKEREDEVARLNAEIVQLKVDNFASKAKLAAQERTIKKLDSKRKSEFGDLLRFLSHQVTFQVKFSITEKNTGKADGSLKIPLTLGSLTVDPSVGDERERLGERTVKMAADFEDFIDEIEKPANQKACRQLRPVDDDEVFASRYPITGRIGLAEVVEQYMQVSEQAVFQKGTDAYTDKIQFKTTISGGIKPKITITPATGYTLTGNFELSGSRIDLHEVLVGLYREDPKADAESEKITRVLIVKEPEF